MNPDKVTPTVATWTATFGALGLVASAVLQTTVVNDLAKSSQGWAQALLVGLTLLAALGGAIGGGRAAKNHVTPVDNPIGPNGRPLVELSEGAVAKPLSEPSRAKPPRRPPSPPPHG
jgi:hypothetical protein